MGLTIHYSLRSPAPTPAAARELVLQLRQHALDLPFAEVGELIERQGPDCDFEHCSPEDPDRWLLIQAGEHVDIGDSHLHVVPSELIAFSTYPGDGSESANFG